MHVQYAVLLCGQWDGSYSNFTHVFLAIIKNGGSASRLEEMIIDTAGAFTSSSIRTPNLLSKLDKLLVSRRSPHLTFHGDLLISKTRPQFESTHFLACGAEPDIGYGRIKLPSTASGLVFWFIYSQSDDDLMFAIIIARLDALNHSHEDPTQGRECGRLRFGLCPMFIPPPNGPKSTVIRIREYTHSSEAFTVAKELTPPVLRERKSAGMYVYHEWANLKYTHDMAVPRDEWKISILGLADIRISLERLYLNDYESDSDEQDEDKSHLFVDILEMDVLRAKQEDDEYHEDEGEGEKQERHESEQDRERLKKLGRRWNLRNMMCLRGGSRNDMESFV